MAPGDPPLVGLAGATLAYRGAPALRGIDLMLEAGGILALLGPNATPSGSRTASRS